MIELVIPSRQRDLGGGLEVGRVLPFAKRRMIGPFIFLDHMGPADYAKGQAIDVRPHPHIGLATITYLFDGEILHRDSLGSVQPIKPGEVNWMTAGRGITHSERTEKKMLARPGLMHGLQAWVALPNEREETDPTFTHYDAPELSAFDEEGARGVLIAGSAYGLKSGVKIFSPMFYVHLELDPGARLALPNEHEERAAFIVNGRLASGGHTYEAGNLLAFGRGPAEIEAEGGAARVMLLGGSPVGPRYIWWNFVSSSLERMEEAKADWRSRRMAMPAGDSEEFIPLPEDLPMPQA